MSTPSPNPGRRNITAGEFWKQFRSLPEAVQEAARQGYKLFCENPTHPSLNAHMLNPSGRGKHVPGTISVRVGKKYRALYYVKDGQNVWYWIGSHSEYNHFIGDN